MAFPTSVLYRERLTGIEERISVPADRHEAFELVAHIQSLATQHPDDCPACAGLEPQEACPLWTWKLAFRKHTATSWYVMALMTSGAQRKDPFTGRVEIDCDFQFDFCRLMQFEGENTLDYSFRQAFKSFWRALVGMTVEMVNDPNLVAAIVSAEKDGSVSAARTGQRTMAEWETNLELQAAWPDVFYRNPVKESPTWVKAVGCRLRQTIYSVLPSLSWHAIDKAPTGSRIGLYLLDDIETKDTVATRESRDKSYSDFVTFLETAGRVPRIWINCTIHHPEGMVRRIIKDGIFNSRCVTLEDLEAPKDQIPDIAKLCEEAGGFLPVRDENRRIPLPPRLSEIKLDGVPRFLHPLEVANKRLLSMSEPGGIANYFMHNMGDPFKGAGTKMQKSWFRRYRAAAQDRAEGAWLYPVIDGSLGAGDPTWMMMWAALPDKTLSLVDSRRAMLKPSEFANAVFQFCARWRDVGKIQHGRVENYAQATYDFMINEELRRLGENDFVFHGIKGKASSDLRNGRRGGGNRIMEWNVIEPAARLGRLWLPEQGLIETDEFGVMYDAVAYLLDTEIEGFPTPKTDEGLACLRILLWPGDPAKGIPEVDFPEDLETRRVRAMAAAMGPQEQAYGGGGEDSWMEVGLW